MTFSDDNPYAVPPCDAASGWEGSYEYAADQDLQTSAVPFTMHLIFRGDGFTGSIVEEPPGIPEIATLEGSLVGHFIRFTKRYKSLWVFDEAGMPVAVPDQPPQIVECQGELVSDRQQIKGTWRIPAESRTLYGELISFPDATGTWTARATS